MPRLSDNKLILLRNDSKSMEKCLIRGKTNLTECIARLKSDIKPLAVHKLKSHNTKTSCFDKYLSYQSKRPLSFPKSGSAARCCYKVLESPNKKVINDISAKSVKLPYKMEPDRKIQRKVVKVISAKSKYGARNSTVQTAVDSGLPLSSSSSKIILENEKKRDDINNVQKNKKIKIMENSFNSQENMEYLNRLSDPGNKKPTRYAETILTLAEDKNHKPVNDFWASRGQPLLGYDFVAGSLDNVKLKNALNLPESYYEELKLFRDCNSQECLAGTQNSKLVLSPNKKEDVSTTNFEGCVHYFRDEIRTEEHVKQKSRTNNTDCNICNLLSLRKEESALNSVVSKKENCVKTVYPVFDVPISNSLSLVQNCINKKGHRKITCILCH